MQISYNWLSEYLPEYISPENLSELLTSIGLEVESLETTEQIKGGLKGVVVGEVMECNPHPNADKLKLTQVNTGNGDWLNIVCGAPNVAKGQKVLVATIGAKLYPDGEHVFEIKPAKIRGEDSQGMLCAEDELGIGQSHAGIMVLPEDTPVGLPASAYFKLGEPDIIIEIGLTPNRSDAMSHLGVARDVCTYLTHHKGQKYEVRYPHATLPPQAGSLPISVEILDTGKCPRYAGMVISNVKVQESPDWLKKKLLSIGQKPINNIVDITNFVLQEYGHPLHAFDYDQINGNKIIVQTLPSETPFTTLDKQEKKLDSEDLMICDEKGGICIAGVMGGWQSGVTEQTRNVFIEAAYFDPKSVRRTSLRHNLRTEAATHFEKTVSVDNVIPVLHRAVSLILEIAGGSVASGQIDHYPQPLAHKEVSFRYDYINLLCGKEYEPDAIDGILNSMGFEILDRGDVQCRVRVPFSKSDISQAADIAEEILRIDGLNQVPVSGQISFALSSGSTSSKQQWKEKICQWLSDQGMNEILTNSIVNSRYYPSEHLVRMINSLSSELDAMRPDMVLSGLDVLAYNINRGEKNLSIYEWGNIYHQYGPGRYNQQERLAVWTTGLRSVQQWQAEAVPHDIYYLKGVLNGLAARIGLKGIKENIQEDSIVLSIGKKRIAEVRRLDASVLRQAGIKQDVYYAELYVSEWWQQAEKGTITYKEINKFPTVERDLSLVLDQSVTYEEIDRITQTRKLPALQTYKLFDIFEGEKLGTGKRAWALNYVFQAEDGTLTDADVDSMMQRLVQEYEVALKAEIRK
ncbi:MAG: phenylalanine--tRNA ligase subunit beta [Taibaiella sp.]|nr:phenylalanine--tRNA ligase subunit beta [Taibaiella sp.]